MASGCSPSITIEAGTHSQELMPLAEGLLLREVAMEAISGGKTLQELAADGAERFIQVRQKK